jgi:hypothetical protein
MLPSRIERATGVSGALATSVLLAVALVVTTISAVPAGADPVAWEERAVIWDSHGVPTDLGPSVSPAGGTRSTTAIR